MTMKTSTKPDEAEKQLHKEADEKRKQDIRDICEVLLENMEHFNPYALAFIEKEWATEMVSIIRWVVSHGYFDKKHKKPEFPASTPTLVWMYAELAHGVHTPMMTDIGICIQPIVQNSRTMEHAARRIHDRLYRALYAHVTDEDARKDMLKHREAQDKKRHNYERAAYERDRRKKVAPPPATWDPEKYVEMKTKERQKARKAREKAKEESMKHFEQESRRLARVGSKA